MGVCYFSLNFPDHPFQNNNQAPRCGELIEEYPVLFATDEESVSVRMHIIQDGWRLDECSSSEEVMLGINEWSDD